MMNIWEMTLTGGIMALAITVLRAVLLNKLPKRTFVFLWEIAMLRLVLPISIPAVTSVYSLFALFGKQFDNSETAIQTIPATNAINIPVMPNVLVEGTFQAAESPLQENIQTGVSVPLWTVVWLVGMVITFAVFVIGYIIVYRRYRYATIVKDGYAVEWLSEQKIRRKIRIFRSEQTQSPLTYGIFRPTIILPESLENNQSEQLTYILTHEMTHIKWFDMLRKIAAAALLCVHWFNPLVWVLFMLYNRDIELACDEAVVRKMSGDCRSAYAMALIGMEERRRGFSSLYSHFSKNAIEERIVAIMKIKKIGAVSTAAACVLSLGVICGFATSAAADNKSPKSDNEASVVDAIMISNHGTGETYYSFDNGKTFLEQKDVDIQIPKVEWWTYEEYKAWLDKEKVELQGMLGEKGWTGGRGDFIWTQEIIDETIAEYEDILEQIKNGVKVSKSVDGDTGTMLMQSFPAGQTSEMSTDELSEIAEMSKDEVLEKFGKYGISFDENGQMLYNGELIRFFCDGCEIDGGWAINRSFYNENGKVDVYAAYEATSNGDGSVDPMGKLKGLRKATKEEFDNLNFAKTVTEEVTFIPSTFDIDKNSYEISISDEVTKTILVEGTADNIYAVSDKNEGNSAVTGTSFESIFAKYKKYGIEYKAVAGGLGNVYFNGELVKKFYDVTDNGAFSMESTDGGKIIVSTVYDDNGNLIGVKEVSQDSIGF